MEKTYNVIDLDKNIIPDYCFKVVFSGNTGVGKTSIINYEIHNKFEEENQSLIVFEHFYKNYRICDKILRLQIWDTCGESTYVNLMQNFYRSALCIFIVFSLDDENSFSSLNNWFYDIKNINESESPMIILIGNKKDNMRERQVSKEDIKNYCKNNDIDNYFETSAKNGESIHELFKEVVRKLYIRFIEPNNSDIYSTRTFESSTRNSEINRCGINSERCKVCDCSIY
jgi:Ras-related protein Rab-6A